MKLLSFILFFISNVGFCQVENDVKLGTVSNERMNIVYRGILNPLSISVSDAKSFTAEGDGLRYENGKYYLSPGQGLESIVTLKIIKSELLNKKNLELKIFQHL